MALDTKDGIVRELVPLEANKHPASPTFTWDGNRVVWNESCSKTLEVINWDGSNRRVIARNYWGDGHCWRSPEGKDWVLGTQWAISTTAQVKFQLINIDNPDEKIDLITTTWSRPDWSPFTTWASISADGKIVAAGFPNYNQLGFLDLSTTNRKVTYFSDQGCWPTMSRGNQYHCLYTSGNIFGHKGIRIIDRNQREVLKKALGADVLGGQNNEHESLRWTPDPDYITLYAYKSGWSTIGIPNPRIVRISDLRWVAINDNPTTSEGNTDVFFYSEASPAIKGCDSGLQTKKNLATCHIYDMRGRDIQKIQSRYHHVVVHVTNARLVSVIKKKCGW